MLSSRMWNVATRLVHFIPIAVLATTCAWAAPISDGAASPFGVVCPWHEVSQTGARWTRCGAGATQIGNWPVLEPERGKYDWGPADREWDGWMIPERLFAAPILGYTPGWASSGPQGEARSVPRNVGDFARFSCEIALRYAGRISVWECWNEPNIDFFRGTIAEFADMQKAMAVGVLRGNRDAAVIFGGLAGADLPFLQRCYEQGAGPYFDIMAVHPYQWDPTFNDGWFTEKLTNLRNAMDGRGDTGKPVWLNEFGWSTGDGRITEEIQARLLVQGFVTSLGLRHLGVERAFWFCVKDWGGPGYGLFAEDSRKKPAFLAYQQMTRELVGREYLGKAELSDGRAHVFGPKAGQGAALLVAWAAGAEPVSLNVAIPGGPFSAREMLGMETSLPQLDGAAATATPNPLYIDVPEEAARKVAQLLPQPGFAAQPAAPERRPLVWASVHPPAGTERVWLVPGQERKVDLRVFNGTDASASGEVVLLLAGGEFRASVEVPAWGLLRREVAVSVPADLKPGLVDMQVGGKVGGIELAPYATPVRVATGPTIELLANSHLERDLYVRPGAQGGMSESRRFGSEWVYKLPVLLPGRVEVSMIVGAHLANEWSVSWSQDGKSWTPLLSGKSWAAPHEAVIDAVAVGDLYLRCKGNDQQVDSVRVTFCGER